MRDSERFAISDLVRALVGGAYEELVEDGRAGRLSAIELSEAIKRYGCRLAELPPSAFDFADCYHIENAPQKLTLDLPLWTIEEGRSDLTLSLTLERRGREVFLQIDDLHVP